MILAEDMANEMELLEAIDEMLDEYIDLSEQIKKFQGWTEGEAQLRASSIWSLYKNRR